MKTAITPVAAGLAAALLSGAAFAKSTIGGVVFVNSYGDNTNDGNGVEVSSSEVELANNSRIRVRWDNEDDVGMYIEGGIADEIKVRHAYGTWDIDEKWQILAGKTSTPFAPLNPEVAMVHNSGQSVGSVSPGRQFQVRLTRKFLNRRGALAVALVDPDVGTELTLPDTEETLGIQDSNLPRIDIGAAYRTFGWQLFPSAFYYKRSYAESPAEAENEVTTFGYSLGLRTGTGPFTVAAEVGVGQNWGSTGSSLSGSPAGDNSAARTFMNDGRIDIADADNTGFWTDFGYRFTAGEWQGSVHLLYGEQTSKFDDLDDDFHSTMVGISIPLDLPWIARGLRIRPEIFHFDYSDNTMAGEKRDKGSRTIAGVQMQYTF